MISDSIKEYINNNIGECNNKLEIAYTIYILLGKVLYYSPLYYRYKSDDLLPDIGSITLDNPYVNDDTWSRLYKEILNEYGIESEIKGDKHKRLEFDVDNYRIRTDATVYNTNDVFDISSDLTNIKFGLDIIYFQLINNQYRESFLENIDRVNERFNIIKGNNFKVLENIKSNIDRNKHSIKYGMNFYNEYYKMCDGEEERRQLFERYYYLLFGYYNNELIEYDFDSILSKHLLIFGDKYYLETKDGFINIDYEQLLEFIENNNIQIDNSFIKKDTKKHTKRR